MKIAKNALSIVLSFVLVFTALIPAFATAVPSDEETTATAAENVENSEDEKTQDEGTSYDKELEEQWDNTEEAKRGIVINPGKDETERNFRWYMAKDVIKARVEISENEDMSEKKSFDA